jgi:hypothetical protein
MGIAYRELRGAQYKARFQKNIDENKFSYIEGELLSNHESFVDVNPINILKAKFRTALHKIRTMDVRVRQRLMTPRKTCHARRTGQDRAKEGPRKKTYSSAL